MRVLNSAWRILPTAMALVLFSAGLAFSQSPTWTPAVMIQAKDTAELTQKFCAADPNVETIVVLPSALFVDSQELTCGSGSYKLYRIAKADDPDDFIYFLDPPLHARAITLGCDGKAGKSMKSVAINCRPCPPLFK